jgi:tryptophan synthase beta chain
VGAGSNAIGLFHPFLDDDVQMIGVEAYGAASLNRGTLGVLHGSYGYLLQDKYGQIQEAHSIAAGLDYPGVGPEHGLLKDLGRAQYVTATDEDAIAAFKLLAHTEGIIPALESAHALAHLKHLAPTMPGDAAIIVGLSGRGDKDVSRDDELMEVKQ